MRSSGRSARAPSGRIAVALPRSAMNSRRLTILSPKPDQSCVERSLAHISPARAMRRRPLLSYAMPTVLLLGLPRGLRPAYWPFSEVPRRPACARKAIISGLLGCPTKPASAVACAAALHGHAVEWTQGCPWLACGPCPPACQCAGDATRPTAPIWPWHGLGWDLAEYK